MVENDLRVLFSLEADGEQPLAQISIPAAGRRARTRQRRRQLVAIASPVLAAAAVIAVVASGVLVGADHGAGPVPPHSGGPTSPAPSESQASPPLATATDLNPLTVYATFGWLPAGQHIGNIGTGRAWMFVNAEPAGFTLAVYAPGECLVKPVPKKTGRTELSCTGGIHGTGVPAPIVSKAPDINGHRAYWLGAPGPYLAWQYAPGGWAALSYPSNARPSTGPGLPSSSRSAKPEQSPLAVKVADRVVIGPARARPIRFPARLSGVPASWQVSSTDVQPQGGLLAADLYQITSGPVVLAPDGAGLPQNTPQIAIAPAKDPCTFSGGHPVRQVIAGYRVQTVSLPGQHLQELCAADADGLFVYIYLAGDHPALSARGIFTHLHLLGPDPANWTTKPIG